MKLDIKEISNTKNCVEDAAYVIYLIPYVFKSGEPVLYHGYILNLFGMIIGKH